MHDTTYIDNFINQCLDDFIDGEYDYDYGEEVVVGGMKAMTRYGNDFSVIIQSSKRFFSVITIQDDGEYFYYSTLTNTKEAYQCFGPIEKFKDKIESIMTLHLLEAL